MQHRPRLSSARSRRASTPILYTDELGDFRVGGSRIVRGGRSNDGVAVIAARITVHEAVVAADQQRDAIKVRVIDAYSVKPIDTAALVGPLRTSEGLLCVAEDHWVEGGLGDVVLAALAEAMSPARSCGSCTSRCATSPDPASRRRLDAAEISAKHIAHAVREELAAFATRRARWSSTPHHCTQRAGTMTAIALAPSIVSAAARGERLAVRFARPERLGVRLPLRPLR